MMHMGDTDAKRFGSLIPFWNWGSREPVWDVALLDLLNKGQVVFAGFLLVTPLSHAVVDKYWHLLGLANGLVDELVEFRHPGTFHMSFGESDVAVRTGEFFVHFSRILINCRFPEDHLAGALRAHEDIRPDGVIDAAFGLAVRVRRLVHPAAFVFDFLENAFGLALKFSDIHGRVVVVGNERGRW